MAKSRKYQARPAAENQPLYFLTFLGLAVLLFYPPYFRGLFFKNEQQWTLMLAALIFFVTWLWKLSRREVSFLQRPLDLLIAGLVVCYTVSFFWAANQRLAVAEIVKVALYFLTYWNVSQLVTGEKQAFTLLNVLYTSALGVAMAGILTAMDIIHIKDGFVGNRIFSTLQYPNALAIYLAAVSFLGFALWDRVKPQWRYLYAAGNYLLLLVFLTTNSRGGFLVYPLALVIYLVGLPSGRKLKTIMHILITGIAALVGNSKLIPSIIAGNNGEAWLWFGVGLAVALAGQALAHGLDMVKLNRRLVATIGVAVLVVAVLAAGFLANGEQPAVTGQDEVSFWSKVLPAHLLQRIKSISMSEYSAQSRFFWSMEALKIIKDYPVFGLGGGAWESAYRAYQSYFYSSTQVHNHWVQLWAEVGTVGLLVYVGIWAVFLWSGVVNWRLHDGDKKVLQWAVLTAAIALGIHAVIDFDLALSAISLLLYSMFGLTRAWQREAAREMKVLAAPQYFSTRWYWLGLATVITLILMLLPASLLAGNFYAKKAVAAAKAGNRPSMKENFTKAARYDPFSASYIMDLAKLTLVDGDREKALSMAEKALAKDRFNWQLHAHAAEMYWQAGMVHKAVEKMETSRDLLPWGTTSWNSLARIYTLSGIRLLEQGKIQEGRDFLDKATAIPGQIEAKMAGMDEDILKLWRQKRLVVSPAIQLNAGISNYLLGRWQEAEKLLTAALQSEKEKGEALWWLSILKEKQGKIAEAVKLQADAEKILPQLAKEYPVLKELPVLR